MKLTIHFDVADGSSFGTIRTETDDRGGNEQQRHFIHLLKCAVGDVVIPSLLKECNIELIHKGREGGKPRNQ